MVPRTVRVMNPTEMVWFRGNPFTQFWDSVRWLHKGFSNFNPAQSFEIAANMSARFQWFDGELFMRKEGSRLALYHHRHINMIDGREDAPGMAVDWLELMSGMKVDYFESSCIVDYFDDHPAPLTSDIWKHGDVESFKFNSFGIPNLNTFAQDLAMFSEEPLAVGFRTKWFRKIGTPMVAGLKSLNEKQYDAARDNVSQMPENCDWRAAALNFVDRIEEMNPVEKVL